MSYDTELKLVYNGAILSLKPTLIDTDSITYTLTVYESHFDHSKSISIDICDFEMDKIKDLVDDAINNGHYWRDECLD